MKRTLSTFTLGVALICGLAGASWMFLPSQTESWTPASKSGLVVWFDATQLTGLSDDDLVTTFTDFSGNGRDATSSGAARARYEATAFNSKPCLEFDGTTDWYEFGSATTWSFDSDSAVVTIVQGTDPGAGPWYQALLSLKTNAASGAQSFEIVNIQGDSARPGLSFGLTGRTANSRFHLNIGEVAIYSGLHTLMFNYDGTGTEAAGNNLASDWVAQLNGSTQTDVVNTGSSDTLTTKNLISSRAVASPPSLPWDGYICEIFVYDTQLDAGDLAALDAYVASKWGI